MDNTQKGVLYTALAYLLWGILPSYWRAVSSFNDYDFIPSYYLVIFLYDHCAGCNKEAIPFNQRNKNFI